MRTEGGMAVPGAVLKCSLLSLPAPSPQGPSRLPVSSSSIGKGFRDL